MAVWFDINPRSGVPLFKQIIEQVRRAIATGMLAPDEKLPTVRELAEEHSLNPNTIAKAYQNLEVLGLVYTRPGVKGGTFVAGEGVSGVRQLEFERFQAELTRVIRDGYNLGLAQPEFEERFRHELQLWYAANPATPGAIEEARKSGALKGE